MAAAPGEAAHPAAHVRVWPALRRDPRFALGAAVVAVFTLMALAPGLFTSQDPTACDLRRSLRGPSPSHWFGFDVQGCDYYALTVGSAGASMAVGPLVAVLAAVLGGALGAVGGFLGGPVDALLARVTDVWLAVPPLLGGVVILSFVGQRSVVEVAVVLALLSWPPLLRAMRGSVLERREEQYVEAARALGASRWRLLRRHVGPNALGPVVVAGAVSVGVAVSAEALLSFMGTGISLPDTSWGLLLSVSRDRIAEAPHLLLPGLFLVLLVVAFVLLAEALRDVLDPRTR